MAPAPAWLRPIAMGVMLSPLAAAAQTPPAALVPDSQISQADALAWRRIYDDSIAAFRRQDYAAAESLARQALAFAEAHFGRDHMGTLTSLDTVAVTLREQGRHAEALPLFRRLFEARERRFGADAEATQGALLAVALAAHGSQAYAEAESAFRRLLPALEARAGPDNPDILAIVRNLATLNFNLGRHADAVRYQMRVVDSFVRSEGERGASTLTARDSLALMYQAQGRRAEALDLMTRTRAAAEESLGATHPVALAIIVDLAIIHAEAGRLELAIDHGQRALDRLVARFGREAPATLAGANSLAGIYQTAGRYAEAEPLRQHYLEASERLHGPDHSDAILGAINLGALYADQGRIDEARRLAQRALQSLDRRPDGGDVERMVALTNLASAQADWGDHETAMSLRRQSLTIAERLYGPDHYGTLAAAAALGTAYRLLDRFEEAEREYRRALAGQERVLGVEDDATLITVNELGRLYRDQGRRAEAAAHFARALDGRTRTLGPDHPATIESANDLARLRLGAPDTAASALEPARRAVAGLRARLAWTGGGAYGQVQRGREQLVASAPFEQLADAAWAAAEAAPAQRDALTAEAFVALQEAMPGTADRALRQMAVRRIGEDRRSGLSAVVREREELAARWTANNFRRGTLAGEGSATAATRELVEDQGRIERRIGEIDRQIGREFQDYYALVRPAPLTLAETQALLGADEAILLVVPTDAGTHVMAIVRDRVRWVRSGWARGRINQSAALLLQDIRNVLDTAGERFSYNRQTAFGLYREIVAPVAATLRGKRTVFVAAAGSLGATPFGILVTDTPSGADSDPAALRSTKWFADDHALLQLPSIQSLAMLRRVFRRPSVERSGEGFVGFGNPVLQGSAGGRCGTSGPAVPPSAVMIPGLGADGRPLANVTRLRALCPLPATAQELEQMRGALHAPAGALFTAGAATEPRVRGMDLRPFRILAFATHGLVAGELGAAEPGLVLTPPAVASGENDGYLAASEVSALRLDADWVILSACNTAAGDGSAGAPALSGLARAFFYAGARSVLASHWKVVDDAGARLTVLTIQLQTAASRLDRAQALQVAMRTVRMDPDNPFWAHPAVWGPFTLIGDNAG